GTVGKRPACKGRGWKGHYASRHLYGARITCQLRQTGSHPLGELVPGGTGPAPHLLDRWLDPFPVPVLQPKRADTADGPAPADHASCHRADRGGVRETSG